MPAQLIVLSGVHAGRSIALGDAPAILGRNPDCTVVLASARASRRHAEIRPDAAGYLLIDLGSANGTFVNGQRLAAPYRLRHGDVLQIGEESFRFDAPQPAISAPPTVPVTPAMVPVPPAAQPPAGYPAPDTQSSRRGAPRWFLALALVGLVAVAACAGALVVGRSLLPGDRPARPTSEAARPTPEAQATTAPAIAPTRAPTNPPAATGASWTVLVYLDGDNNLEADALGDLNEMELVGSNDDVQVVVQLDRISLHTPEDDTSNGDWTTTKRYLVQRDADEEAIRSDEIADLGELNMGDPQTLADFVVWGMQTYPAERYALVLWDHGSSWAGIAFDDTDGEDGISMPELDAALRTIQAQTGVAKLDLIGFDACLMSQIDVLQTVAPYGHVMVASAELEPGEGWAWDLLLADLAEAPGQDGAALGRAIVASYQAFYEGGDDDTVTMAAFDLARAQELVDGLDALARAMESNIAVAYPAVAEARSYAEAYSQPRPEEFSAVDLGHFAALVQERGAPAPVAVPARMLGAAIDGARIAAWSAPFHANHTGISVFFPQIAELYPELYTQASPTPGQTAWDEFLAAFHAAASEVQAPQIAGLFASDTIVGVNNPLTLEGTVSGADIAYVFFFVGVPSADSSGVLLSDVDFIYPPGSVPGDSVPPWSDGANDVTATWGGTQWGLTNGTDSIPVLLGPVRYGTDLYGVEGIYTAQGTGEQTPAGLLFRLGGGTPELQAIYGFPKGRKQEAQPYEITPSPGDTFTALIRSYTLSGDRLEPGLVEGDTLTFGAAPPALTRLPANSGDYVAGFLVRDVAGRFSYAYQEITVDNAGAGPNIPLNPTPAPAQGGALAYQSGELGFRLEYPATWETLDTGNSQIYFYDPASGGNVFVSVDVYSTGQPAEQANQELLDSFLAALERQAEPERGDVEQAALAGEEGPGVRYAYTDEGGERVAGLVVALTSPRTGLSYLVSIQAPAAEFDDRLPTFQAILDTLRIE
ncbi:MAG TPA: clostripain-related cysteine peptidase [Roseiflexaceae bacterium]|nr:clostripain-related cysteine peptidase [Roseiflexaceae bacterium]